MNLDLTLILLVQLNYKCILKIIKKNKNKYQASCWRKCEQTTKVFVKSWQSYTSWILWFRILENKAHNSILPVMNLVLFVFSILIAKLYLFYFFFRVESAEIKNYFPYQKVLSGLFDICKLLFNIEFKVNFFCNKIFNSIKLQ